MPNNFDDIIDSRDVVARIEELESDDECNVCCEPMQTHDLTTYQCKNGHEQDDPLYTGEREELESLRALAAQGEISTNDWRHGATLIRDSYFEKYAQDFAEDIGAVDPGYSWPLSCIDWERATRELQMDYTSIDFDGVTYWTR